MGGKREKKDQRSGGKKEGGEVLMIFTILLREGEGLHQRGRQREGEEETSRKSRENEWGSSRLERCAKGTSIPSGSERTNIGEDHQC